jgi:transposase
MRKIKEILRLKFDLKRTNRDIAKSLGVSNSTVGNCLRRQAKLGLDWSLATRLDAEELEKLLYPTTQNKIDHTYDFEWIEVHQRLKRKGITLLLLWEEYKQKYPSGVSYSRYCHVYREWKEQLDVCLRQSYVAGEKMFVDYAGLTLQLCNCSTGEKRDVQIFVAVLGASNYTYTEATLTQSLPDWIASHVRAFNFFGGVPEIVVPDNLKSGVHKSHLYEPDLNPTYQDMAEHYSIAVIPTRVRTPQDKAKVEEAVQNVERRILAKLCDRTFFSLHEINEAIKPLLAELNVRPFQKIPGSRLSQFEEIEKMALKALPVAAYTYAEWSKFTVGKDYHVALKDHYYSVPYTLTGKKVDIRYTQSTVEIFYHGKRAASHQRSYERGKSTTVITHMPKSHQEYVKWTPREIMDWAANNGKAIPALFDKIIASHAHPQQSFRVCLGIMRLEKSYGKARLEAACNRALTIGAFSYKSIKSILQNNLDRQPIANQQISFSITMQQHEYVRGSEYFQ